MNAVLSHCKYSSCAINVVFVVAFDFIIRKFLTRNLNFCFFLDYLKI